MFRIVFALTAAGFLFAGSTFATAEIKHSGVVLNVDPNGPTITLEEMGPWTPPDHGLGTRSIGLKPDTTVELAARSNEVDTGGWPGGFRISPLRPTDLQNGDYATVTTDTQDGRLVARSITVIRVTGTR